MDRLWTADVGDHDQLHGPRHTEQCLGEDHGGIPSLRVAVRETWRPSLALPSRLDLWSLVSWLTDCQPTGSIRLSWQVGLGWGCSPAMCTIIRS